MFQTCNLIFPSIHLPESGWKFTEWKVMKNQQWKNSTCWLIEDVITKWSLILSYSITSNQKWGMHVIPQSIYINSQSEMGYTPYVTNLIGSSQQPLRSGAYIHFCSNLMSSPQQQIRSGHTPLCLSSDFHPKQHQKWCIEYLICIKPWFCPYLPYVFTIFSKILLSFQLKMMKFVLFVSHRPQ